MPPLRKTLLLFLALIIVGLVKLPFEKGYTAELRERGVIPPALSVEKWNYMGQTGLAGMLGGLRSVVAVWRSFKAYGHFTDQEWYELENEYDLITTLDPQNPYYWNTGGWHLGYNAAAWARNNRDFKPVQRDTIEREYLEKADVFFHQGLKHLPNEIQLWSQIGIMWSHPHKRPDFPRAAKAWKEAAERGSNEIYQRRYLYTLAQVRGREREALDYARQLLQDSPYHMRLPAFRVIYWILHTLPDLPPEISRPPLEEVFGDKARAYRELYNYRFRVHQENFYAGDLDKNLQQLIEELKIPEKLNPFLNPRRLRLTVNEWNKVMERKN